MRLPFRFHILSVYCSIPDCRYNLYCIPWDLAFTKLWLTKNHHQWSCKHFIKNELMHSTKIKIAVKTPKCANSSFLLSPSEIYKKRFRNWMRSTDHMLIWSSEIYTTLFRETLFIKSKTANAPSVHWYENE